MAPESGEIVSEIERERLREKEIRRCYLKKSKMK